jgi:hypothetical protein
VQQELVDTQAFASPPYQPAPALTKP